MGRVFSYKFAEFIIGKSRRNIGKNVALFTMKDAYAWTSSYPSPNHPIQPEAKSRPPKRIGSNLPSGSGQAICPNDFEYFLEHRGLPCYCQLLLSSCLARAKLSFWPLPTHTRTRALELASRGSALVLLRRKAKSSGMDVPAAKL